MRRSVRWIDFFQMEREKKRFHVYANSSFDDDRNQFVRRKQALPYPHRGTHARTHARAKLNLIQNCVLC